MEPPGLFYKVNRKMLERKSELKGVYLSRPRLVAFYDVNYETFNPGKSILYFKIPTMKSYPIDLNAGYETHISRKAPISDALRCTLIYVMSPKAQVNADNVDKVNVFTKCGALVDLMTWYYKKQYEKRTVLVSRYNGDLYMIDYNFSDKNELKPKNTHHGQLIKNVFVESLKDKPTTNKHFDENKKLLGVYQSEFGKFRMIYKGEIQGIQSKREIKDVDDLETLNNCRFVLAKQMWYTLKRNRAKMLRYWLQAYLLNVSDIYFAYKDNNGIVSQPIVHKQTSQLVKDFDLNPGIYKEFLYEFLQRVNDLLTNDDINSLNTVYQFDFNSKDMYFTYKVFKENTELAFITPEYIEFCKQL